MNSSSPTYVRSCLVLLSVLLLTDLVVSSHAFGSWRCQKASQQEVAVSDKEAREFADRLKAALASNDRDQVRQLIAFEEIVLRGAESVEIPEKYRRGSLGGARDGFKDSFMSTCDFVRNGGSYELVSIRRIDGIPVVLFRLIVGEGGFNYHMFHLRRIRDKVRADEFTIGLTGTKMSDTVRQNFQYMSKLYALTDDEKDQKVQYEEKMKLFGTFLSEARTGDRAKAMELYHQLPKEMRETKMAQLGRVVAHQNGDQAKYAEILEEFIKTYPGDSSMAMVLFDAAVIKGDAELMLKARDMLSKWSGGDPYVDLLVGTHHVDAGDLETAIKLTRDIDPAITNTYYAHTFKIGVALAADDFDCVLQQIRYLRDNYNAKINDLRTVEGYEKFVKSPQFKEWIDESKAEKPKTKSKQVE